MEFRRMLLVLLVVWEGLLTGSCFSLSQSSQWSAEREQTIVRTSEEKGNSSSRSVQINNEFEAFLKYNKPSKIHKIVALTMASVLASGVMNSITRNSSSVDMLNGFIFVNKLNADENKHFNSVNDGQQNQKILQNSSNIEKQSPLLEESFIKYPLFSEKKSPTQDPPPGDPVNLFEIDLLTKTIINISRFMKRVGLIDDCSEQIQNSMSEIVWKLIDFLLVREVGPEIVTQWMYKQWKRFINKIDSSNKINSRLEDKRNCDKNYPRQGQPSEKQIRNLIQIMDEDLIRYFSEGIEKISEHFQDDNTNEIPFFSNSSDIFCSKLDKVNRYSVTECREDFLKLLQASFEEGNLSDNEPDSQGRNKRNAKLRLVDPRRTALETFRRRSGYDDYPKHPDDNSEYVVIQHESNDGLSSLYPLKVIFHIGVYGLLAILTYVIYMMPRHGPDGPKGEEGYYGYKGSLGDHGSRGFSGRPGKKGDPGLKGLIGFRGHKGKKGCKIDGEKGKRGFDGYSGAKGQKGPKGETGDKGHTGKKGPPGLRGKVGRTGIPGELLYNKVKHKHHHKGHHHKGHHHDDSYHGRKAITNQDTLTTLSDSIASGNENNFLKVMTNQSHDPSTDDSNHNLEKESPSVSDDFWKGCPNCPGFKEAYKNILSGNKDSEEIQNIASSYVNRYKAWLQKQKSVLTSGRWELQLEPAAETQPIPENMQKTGISVGHRNESKQISTKIQKSASGTLDHKKIEEKVEKFVQNDIEEKINEAMENIEDGLYASYEDDDSVYQTPRKRRRLSRKRRSRSHERKKFDAAETIYNEEFQRSDYSKCKAEESEENKMLIRAFEITRAESVSKTDKKHRRRRAILKEPESIIFGQNLNQGIYLSSPSLPDSLDFLTHLPPKQAMTEHQVHSASALFHSLNKLWREQLNREGCLKCRLFELLEQQPVSSLEHFIIAGFSHILGTSESLQLLDEVREGKRRGIKMHCQRRRNTCDLELSSPFFSTIQRILNFSK